MGDVMADEKRMSIGAGTVETDVEAPRWRREPFLILFPLGLALSWSGVGHWLLHAVGVLPDYRPIFHAMVQIQGFMMCFAVGFLFTMIPRRTASDPASVPAIAIAITAPLLTTWAAWHERWFLSQAAWLVLAVTVIAFVLRRFRSSVSGRRPPNSFVWIPVALLMGLAGSIMTGIYGVFQGDYMWLHNFGRGLVLQGMFLSLVLGVGGLVLPLMTRGQAPLDHGTGPRDRMAVAAHLVAAALLALSFWLEGQVSLSIGMWLRAAVVGSCLVAGAQLWRLPSSPGWNRRLIWLSAWMIPLGYVVAALFPLQFKAGLHIVFIGGFALMALSVSTQVILGHCGYASLANGKPWQVPATGALIAAAVSFRVWMEFDKARFFEFMALAALCFMAASLLWASLLVPKMIKPLAQSD